MRHTRPIRRARFFTRSPRGFTLLEVVLALGLSVVVLATVGVAINTYMKLSTERQVDVEQARIAQAVLRKMERDIRSVVFRPPQPVASTTGQAAASCWEARRFRRAARSRRSAPAWE